MVERGAEGLLAVQRQVAAVQASGQEGLEQCSAEMRHRLEDLHRNHHRHQDLIQVRLCTHSYPLPVGLFGVWRREGREENEQSKEEEGPGAGALYMHVPTLPS